MPDFRMTVSEAARFWALDLATCMSVLSELSRTGVVSQAADCRYIAASP